MSLPLRVTAYRSPTRFNSSNSRSEALTEPQSHRRRLTRSFIPAGGLVSSFPPTLRLRTSNAVSLGRRSLSRFSHSSLSACSRAPAPLRLQRSHPEKAGAHLQNARLSGLRSRPEAPVEQDRNVAARCQLRCHGQNRLVPRQSAEPHLIHRV